MEHDVYLISYDFWHKRKIVNFAPYNVILAIATNILQRLKTGLVVQCYIYLSLNYWILYYISAKEMCQLPQKIILDMFAMHLK